MPIYKLLKYLKIIGLLIRLSKLLPLKILNKSHNEILIPVYHTLATNHVITEHLFNSPTKKKFKNDIYFMLKNYRSISLKKIIDLQNGNRSKLKNRFHVTFDDGFADHYYIAMDFLKQNEIDATFFIVKDFLDNKSLFYRNKASLIIDKLSVTYPKKFQNEITEYMLSKNLYFSNLKKSIMKIKHKDENHLNEIAKLCDVDFDEYLTTKKPYMTSDQINELIDHGFSVGSHSVNHTLLQDLTEEEQKHQVSNSMEFIQNKFGLDYKVFAAPFSDKNLKKSFIEYLLNNNIIDAFFGTQGFRLDTIPNSYQRFAMDGFNSNVDMKKVLKDSLSVATILKPMNDFNVLR